jgi:hypothetical protein
MARPAKQLRVDVAPEESKPWAYIVEQPTRLVVYEDAARKHMLTLRWWTGTNWQRKTLGKKLTRTPKGEPDKDLVAWAISEGMKQALLLAGQMPHLATSPAPVAKPVAIGEAWAIITDAETGKYRTDTLHRREIKAALEYAELVWGKERPWSTIGEDEWLRLMRRRLEGFVKRGHNGIRRTEITVSRIDTVARVLRAKKRIPIDAARPPEDWRLTIHNDWRELTGSHKAYVPARPRHTLEEMRKLLEAALSDDTDPRFRLLFVLGAEYRLGQVVRSWRSDLDVDAGTFTVHGAGKKKGETIDLTPSSCSHRDRGARGRAQALEDRRVAGELADYPLFPAGHVRTAKAGGWELGKLDEPLRSASREWVHKQFRLVEDRAAVKHVDFRGAYGIRRVALDAALDKAIAGEQISERGLMASGGWSDPKVPHTIYAEAENRAGREEAKRVRARIRGEEGADD